MGKRIPDPDEQVAYLAYINRENDFQHHGYAEEMKQYQLMWSGDPAAVDCFAELSPSFRHSFL